MKFECVVKQGHKGSGKFNEHKIFIYANNILEAFSKAKNAKSVKKGKPYLYGQGIISIKQIVN
jgi:hypothetical protein